jgi:glycosyltransferase involved in cell wall biosynthesis
VSVFALDARKLADYGIGSYLRGLARALPPLLDGEELVLLGRRAELEGARGLPPLRWAEERSPLYSLGELVNLPRTARRAGADLLHVPHYTLPFGRALPVVVTVHDLVHLRFPEHRTLLHRLYARLLLGRVVARAAAVVAVSESTRADLRARFGAAAERVRVVPNGIDERFFAPPAPGGVEETLAALGLAPGYLLFVGNPLPHKNVATLLAAYGRLRARDSAAPPLVLAGSRGAACERLRALVGGARLEGAAHVVGELPAADLPALYAGAALLVLPSLWEGFGLPAAEAMACGVPVVAAERGGLPEVVGDAGELVDPESAEAIAGTIAALLVDPERRRALAARGRERAQRFRWEGSAQRTLEIYRAVLASPERRA